MSSEQAIARLREPAPVQHGPFPIYWVRVLAGVGVLLMGWALFSMGLERVALTCERDATSGGRCTLVRGFPGFVRHMEIPLVRVHGVHVAQETTHHKGSVTYWGVPYIDLHGTAPLRSMRATPEEARAFAATIEAGLRGDSRSFGASLHGPWWAVVASIVCVAGGIVLIRSGLRGFGRFEIEIDAADRVLAVKRSMLGIRVSTRVIALESVHDVRIEWRYTRDHIASRHEPLERTGRLVLVDEGGNERPLTDQTFRGLRVHLLAATALRARLGLSPAFGRLEAELEEASKPVPHPWGSTIGGNLGAAWIGACCGSLLGMAIIWSAAVAFGLDSGDGDSSVWPMTGAFLGVVGGVWVASRAIRPRPPR